MVKSIRSAKKTALVQQEAYVSERTADTKWSVTNMIKKINFPLIRNPPEIASIASTMGPVIASVNALLSCPNRMLLH